MPLRVLGAIACPVPHPRSPIMGGRGIEFEGKIFDAIAYDDSQEPYPGLMEDLSQLYHLSRGCGNLFHIKDSVPRIEVDDGSS